MTNLVRYATTAVFGAAVIVGGIALLPRGGVGTPARQPPAPVPTLTAANAATLTPASTPTVVRDLRLPGFAPNQPGGEYGWSGESGALGGLHSVVQDGQAFRQTQLVFAVETSCFVQGSAPRPVSVTVAGLAGVYVEPYTGPNSKFVPIPEADQTTGAYALEIGDRTLCVYLTWDAATTQAERDAARNVVASIRGEPFGETGVRINFTLPAGWDTG